MVDSNGLVHLKRKNFSKFAWYLNEAYNTLERKTGYFLLLLARVKCLHAMRENEAMKTAIIYYNFLDRHGIEQKIGGVETYLWNLARLILERGGEPVLLQSAETAFERQVGDITVIGVTSTGLLRKNIRKDLFKAAMSHINLGKDILIFGADHASVRTDYPRALSIQHGISWDLPSRFLRGNFLGKLPFIPDWVCKKYVTYRCYLYFNNCPNRVCVDYNFLNWYRTQITDIPQGNIWVIPNFVDIPNSYQPDMKRHHTKPVRIIFARRFVEYRGSHLMIQSAIRLLKMFPKIEFCFAGEGPDKSLIIETFKNELRVFIKKYLPDESLHIHEKFHIAVIPSLASEGTSLSLAEAMAAGCACVATNVGGMTNMVIHGYNGMLINPSVDDLVTCLEKLISSPDIRIKLGVNAHKTATSAFNLDRWKAAWSDVLDRVQNL